MPENLPLKDSDNFFKRTIYFIILLILNAALFFLFLSIKFSIPEQRKLSFNNNLLINNIIAPKFTNSFHSDVLKLDLDCKPYDPETSIEQWKKKSVFHLDFPSGKGLSEINVFSLKTRNSNLFKDGTLIINTLYPGSGIFGFSILDNIRETIILYNESYYLFNGTDLKEKFNKTLNETFVGQINKFYSLKLDGNKIILNCPLGLSREFGSYNSQYLINKISDQFHNFIKFNYDSSLFISSIENNLGEKVELSKNAEGFVKSIKSENGIYNFSFDDKKNLTEILYPNNTKLLIQRESETYPHQITGITYPYKGKISLKYGLLGKLISVANNDKTLSIVYGNNVIQMQYNDQKFRIDYSDFQTNYYFNEKMYQFNHNVLGFITGYTSENGKYTYEYDDKNNLIVKKYNDTTYKYFYDPDSNILQKTLRNDETLSERTIENGLIKNESNSVVGEIQFDYDAFSSLTKFKIDNLGTYEFIRNEKGLITKVIMPENKQSFFDWNGNNLIEYKDIFNSSYKFNYDKSGNLIEIIYPKGLPNFTVESFYKACNLLPAISNTDFKIANIDFKNRLFEILTPSNEKLSVTLDTFRRIQNVSDVTGKFIRKYNYNKRNKLTSVIFDNNSCVNIEYNEKGQINNYLTSTGDWSKFEFSENNVSKIFTDKDFRAYEYDETGRTKQVSINVILKYGFRYDNTFPSKIASIEYPDKTKILYSYDSKGRIKNVGFPNSNTVNFVYSNDNTCEIKFSSGVNQIEEYNESGQIDSISVTDPSNESIREINIFYKNNRVVAGSNNSRREKITYDNNNNLLAEYSIQSLGDYKYQYDVNQNIVKIEKPSNTVKFEYIKDKNFLAISDTSKNSEVTSLNIVGKTLESKFSFLEINGVGQNTEEKDKQFVIKNFPINPDNNILNIKTLFASGTNTSQNLQFYVNSQSSSIYQFNNNGNLKYIWEDGSAKTYNWNAFMQLKSFQNNNKLIYFNFLPNGLLSSVTSEGKTIYFAYDIYGNIIEEIASTGRSIRKYIYDYDKNRLLFSYDGNTLLYYHTDAFGSVVNITNAQGATVAEYLYSPFGQILFKKEQTDNNFGFLGMYKNPETNLYFNTKGVWDAENVILFKSSYYHPWLSNKSFLMTINNHILPIKLRETRLTNMVLDTPDIPEKISFNQDFIWTNYININPSLMFLKSHLENKQS